MSDTSYKAGRNKEMALIPKGKTLTFEDAKALLGEYAKNICTITEEYLNGEHWQLRKGWVGWYPDDKDSKTYIRDCQLIEKGFTSKGVIKGIIKRLVGAIFGQEPDYDTVSEASAETEASEIDKILVKWWESKKIHNVLQEFIEHRSAYGKALLRFYIPVGLLTESGDNYILPNLTWDKALNLIHLEAVHYSKFENKFDSNFGSDYIVIDLPVENEEAQKLEIHYKDKDGNTNVRLLEEGKDGEQAKTLDLKGNSLVFCDGQWTDAMITPSIHSQQRQVDHAETMESFALHGINFPETVYLNSDLETEERIDTQTQKKDTFFKSIVRGVGTWLNIVGVVTAKADGSESIVPADVKWREPADPQKFRGVSEAKSRNIHEEAGMLYVFLADNPYPSGDSRIEAMTDYLILLNKFETLGDKAGFWALLTAYLFANWIAKQTPKDVNFIFKSKLTIGRLSSADRQLMLQEVQQNVRSRRNYQMKAGVTDTPEKEDIAIEEDMKKFPPQTGNNPNNPQPNKP